MTRARTVATTEVILVVGLLLYVGLALGAERLLALPDPLTLNLPLALLLSLVPAMLWLGYFYLQDRHEPEPKHYVFGVYLAGAFVAAPVASFLVGLVPGPAADGLGDLGWSGARVVQAILVVGLAQELAKLLVVRYSIYLSPEFDEPMDGIIYMTAAGIGVATAENLTALSALEGVHLSVAAINCVVTTLAHACFAGVLGAALSQARFGGGGATRRAVVLLGGLAAAAVLSGTFRLLEQELSSAGLRAAPWRGLALAAGFAAVVFLGVSVLMRKQLRASPFRRRTGSVEVPS